MKISTQAWIGLAQLQIIMALLLFLPAGTLRYWQGWTAGACTSWRSAASPST